MINSEESEKSKENSTQIAINNARILTEKLRPLENLDNDTYGVPSSGRNRADSWTEKKGHRNGCPSTDEDFELRAVCEFGSNEEVGTTGTSDLKSANSKDSVEDSDIANEEEFDSKQDDDDEMKSDNAEEEERQSNGTKKSFKCDQCNKNYTKQQTLEDHKQIHS
ncbi:hypothetical protein PRIPAC_87299, partial [Pristionchus pacificus]|uniref:C2H2-type domain-containing protein n=1 Tax=Pristionchus pacificus TaxID=54126 RepID=A0A2A6CY69_PRIPA